MNLWDEFFGFLQVQPASQQLRDFVDVAIPKEDLEVIRQYLCGQVELLDQAKSVYRRYRWTHDILNEAGVFNCEHRFIQDLKI
jgi:hypothetical protein